MTVEEIAIKLQQTDDRSIRNEGRIKKLEQDNEAIHDLATSIKVMAERQLHMSENLDSLNKKVDNMESEPSKRWNSIVDKTIAVVVAAVVGFFLAKFGL